MEPSEMTDEELTAAVEPKTEEGPVDPPQKEEKKEEKTEELPQEEAPAEEPAQEEGEEEAPEKPLSRREQLRVQDLLRKYGPPKAPSQEPTPDFRETVQTDDETYKLLEDTAQQYAQSRESQVLAQAETKIWRRFLATEDSQVRAKYPELDGANKEKFHPALADAINQRYLRFIGWQPGDPTRGIPETVHHPDASYAEFVEAEMEYINEAASLKAANTTKNIAQQAAMTGLRPDGSSARPMDLSKHPSQMTDDELEAAVVASMPERDARGRFIKKQ